MKPLIPLVFLFVFIAVPIAAAQTIEYTPSTETICNGNVCTKTLYSGTRFVFEDNIWKPIEQAKSLKNVWNIVYLETDNRYGLTVNDYNYTDIQICLKPDASQMGQTIPFRFCNLTKKEAVVAKGQYQACKTEISKQYLSTKEECYTMSMKKALLNYNFTFGSASTTLTIDDPNTENLDDTEINTGYPGDNYGACTGYDLLDSSVWSKHIYLKFDVSDIPEGADILDANLTLEMDTNNLDAAGEGFNVSAHHVYSTFTVDGVEWTEGTGGCASGTSGSGEISYTKRATGSDWNHTAESTLKFDGTTSGSQTWDIKHMIKNVTTDGFDNITVLLNSSNEFGSPDSLDHVSFFSKEQSGNKPVMIVVFNTSNPALSDVAINESTIYTDTHINCSAKYYSAIPNGRLEFVWYKTNSSGTYLINELNGSTGNTLQEGDTGYTNKSIGTGNFTLGDSWKCSARAWNTTDFSSWVNSSSETVYGYARWFTNQSETTSEYNPSTQSFNFNITWNISDSVIETVYIETDISGAATNYTMTNDTYGGDIYNWTYSTVRAAGTYYWKSWGKSNDSLWNITDTWSFSITKNTTNPLYLNITYDGTSYIDSAVSTTSDKSIKIQSYMNYSNSGTAKLYVDGVNYANPTTTTWGTGARTIKCNNTGNANYTVNDTGSSFTMTITAPIVPTGGGGGGGLTIQSAIDCNATIYPRFGMSGSARPGDDIAPFTIRIYNNNLTQSFSIDFIDDPIRDYCAIDFAPEIDIPPYGQQIYNIRCVAPNNTITSNVQLVSSLGCVHGIPITISPSLDIFSDVTNAIKLIVSGEIIAGMLYAVLGVPFIIWIIILIIVAYLLIRVMFR